MYLENSRIYSNFQKTKKQDLLRCKIIERLLKEGSTAEEPLNIQLTDYSSDEGDTSSGSSDNEGKDVNYSDIGPCCQPLKVPPCSPVYDLVKLLKEERKHKKTKPKCKSSNIHKRNKVHRTPLDLPTTDPGSDIQFSTDDELFIDGYGTIPRARRALIQSELQRKYIAEGIGTLQMPPELIVTAAKNKSYERSGSSDKDKKFSTSTAITEFPPIGATRRTNSWHNLNKCVPKIKAQNLNNFKTAETSDSLKFKLNLRKQIWSGVSANVGPGGDRSRPLSWGMPPIGRKKSLQMKDENEALLTACCQKLTEWQENETGSCVQTKSKVTINLITPTLPEKAHKFRKNTTIKSSNIKQELPENRVVRKRNPLTKLAETTQILTRLAKSKTKISSNSRKTSKTGLSYPQTPGNGTGSLIAPLLTAIPKGQKFKTGGISVVTTAQPLKKQKSRSVPCLKENTNESDLEKSFTKKVKSKSKKKKKF